MARQAIKVTGQRVIKAWKEYCEDGGSTFNPNYGMIVMAEKLADFYTMPQLLAAMEFYFRSGKNNYYDFINNIDKVISAMESQQQGQENFEALERETTELIRKIRQSKLGDDS